MGKMLEYLLTLEVTWTLLERIVSLFGMFNVPPPML